MKCPKCGHNIISARYRERGRTVMTDGEADTLQNSADDFDTYGPYECLNQGCHHEWDDNVMP